MNYRNAKFFHVDTIDCEIEHPEHGWIAYHCDRNDPYVIGFDNAALYDAMAADPSTIPYTPPTAEEIAAEQALGIRVDRSRILQEQVDPYAGNSLRWADLTSAQQTELTTYRQALLNITNQSTFPESVTWPTAPDWV